MFLKDLIVFLGVMGTYYFLKVIGIDYHWRVVACVIITYNLLGMCSLVLNRNIVSALDV